VGGGNSAGQSAIYLSKYAKSVYLMTRKESLSSTMSAYLINQLLETPNIYILGKTEVVEARGNDRLTELKLTKMGTGRTFKRVADALYIFIGAKPFTEWISPQIIKDRKGFIETGPTLKTHDIFKNNWKLSRDPYLLETSCPGIFAAGDVRSGSMCRVASAVGEGSMAISFVHRYLTEVK
jgi:thioredoxin reductase (NADPH)